MEKKPTKQILDSIGKIVDESEGHKVGFKVFSTNGKSFWGKPITEETYIEIVLTKAI